MSLRVEGLSQRFGKQAALDDVTIHVERGDCYGFIGHNGAGKTTTMRIMLGLLPITQGRVLVDGFDAEHYPREARARMGALIERPGFHGHWSGPRNLKLLDRLAGGESDIDQLMDLVGLGDVGDKPVRAYSQGMRQRLGVAQALLGDPAYILLDEPTNGLDPDGIQEMRRLLVRLTRDENRTVFISSHQLHELSGVCNRVGVLRKGQLVVEESLETLLHDGRHDLRTDDDRKARKLLGARGVLVEETENGLILDLKGHPPGPLLREVIGAGVEVESYAARQTSLEEIYHGDRGPVEKPAPIDAVPPKEHLAPEKPVWRMIRHEIARWSGQVATPLMLALPPLAGALKMLIRRSGEQADAAAVESGEVISATAANAFEGTAQAFGIGLLILPYIVLGIASQSVAGELGQGTLRNVLLRPISRLQVVFGKALAVVGLALAAYVLFVLVTLGVATWAFDWEGAYEILPNGKRLPFVTAAELWPDFRHLLLSPLLPLAAYAGIGFLAGTVARRSAGALGLALVVGFLLDASRAFVGRSAYLPSTYIPTMGDTSYVQYFMDASTGASNALFEYGATELWVPAAWTVGALALAALVFRRRYVP